MVCPCIGSLAVHSLYHHTYWYSDQSSSQTDTKWKQTDWQQIILTEMKSDSQKVWQEEDRHFDVHSHCEGKQTSRQTNLQRYRHKHVKLSVATNYCILNKCCDLMAYICPVYVNSVRYPPYTEKKLSLITWVLKKNPKGSCSKVMSFLPIVLFGILLGFILRVSFLQILL